jgi:energy-coupling factor transporter ATP-binding protein EcfA2
LETLIKQKPISALHEILKWSVSRPEWQRDALRRIVINGVINQEDFLELNKICRVKHNVLLDEECVEKAMPLDKTHIPPGPGSEASVELVSIGNLQGVNRLPSDQTIIFGAAPGLTVIYGDNGTGKSGYARVIKKACRTRGALPEIRPDVFAAPPTSPPTCDIVCRVASKDYPLVWQDKVPSDPRLANVFVFDPSTADHYLEQDSPSTFTPNGLDVLPKLAKTCDTIKELIKQDIDHVNRDIIATVKNWKYNANTSVGKLLIGLCRETKPVQVEMLSGLDEEQSQRLTDLTEALKSDPKQKAKETRAAAARLKIFAEKVREVWTNLSEDQISALRKMVEDAAATDKVAKAFLSGKFDATYFPGTGGELWRKLWEAARSFSVSFAYKDQSFPVTSDGARCVFCQQKLESATAERLKAFDAFCKDQSQELAERARKELNVATEKFQKIDPLATEYARVEADLVSITQARVASISQFVKNADECLTTTKNNLTRGTWEEPAPIILSSSDRINDDNGQKGVDSTTASPSLADEIIVVATKLEDRAKIEESVDDPETRKTLETERDGLTDRDWLASVKTDVFEQIDRYKQLAKLEACLKDTETTKITTKNTELTKLLVTDAFCQRFQGEVKGLGLRTIAVKLEEIKGKKGETRFGVRLETNADHAVKDIASEGEKRCIALAAFLSELSQASHQSSLVFDDPVSSFDHRYREKTSERLVEEGKVRQVIVFTHDVVFLNDLLTHAMNHGVQADAFHLEWNGNIPGQCIKGLPWDWKTVDDRFDKLDKEQRAIVKAWNLVPNEDNVQSIRRVYSWLRATLERIVEKEVFADVVFRYRSYIDVKKLDGVVGFSGNECKELQRLVQRCHDVTDAHDPAPGKHAVVPAPDEFKADIDATKQLLVQIRNRKKAAQFTSAQQVNAPVSPP